jgi:hypothetical protein
MPDKETLLRAAKDKREGKSASTQAGEFVRETMEHIREGKHGARSAKQAIAIGLSKARRAGVDLPPPKKGRVSAATIHRIELDEAAGKDPNHKVSAKRSLASTRALKKESAAAASPLALSRHAHAVARTRSAADRSAAAKKAAATRARNRSAGS